MKISMLTSLESAVVTDYLTASKDSNAHTIKAYKQKDVHAFQ